jgi:broad specificity phosphatase PhoE
MSTIYFITHPDVIVDPSLPIERWPLSEIGARRMRQVHAHAWTATIQHVSSSAEQKAIDGAHILCEPPGLVPSIIAELGENDRSATGFLEPTEFWHVVEEFFEQPEASVRGWERAIDAQQRIVGAVREAIECVGSEAPTALIAHGGVGCLLMCHLKGVAISRAEEQPGPPAGSQPGSGGGCYFSLSSENFELIHGWRGLDS